MGVLGQILFRTMNTELFTRWTDLTQLHSHFPHAASPSNNVEKYPYKLYTLRIDLLWTWGRGSNYDAKGRAVNEKGANAKNLQVECNKCHTYNKKCLFCVCAYTS